MFGQNHLPVNPTPSLIIPLGEYAIKTVRSTLPIYFRSDHRREILTKVGAPVFLATQTSIESSCFEVLDYLQIKELDLEKNPFPEISTNDMFVNLSTLKHSFESTWHNLRAHESFIYAGLLGESITNLNIIVLADLWDKTACLFLLPVLYHLKMLSNNTSNTMIQVLLTSARFPDSQKTETQKARVYRLLNELNNRILPRHDLINDPILSGMDLPDSMTLEGIRFYLFDTVKEKGLTVSCPKELDVILGNFMLSILNGEAACLLTDSLTQEQMNSNQAYFASAGSTSIIYNPDPIVEYCAARLGAEYLSRDYWPKSGNDKSIVDKLLENVRLRIGDEKSWISRIIARTEFAFVQIENEWDIQYSLDDLILNSPRADKIKACSWLNQIIEYHDQLISQRIPIALSEIEKTNSLIHQELDNVQAEFNLDLLQQVEIHPNVLFNGRAMLFAWKKELEYKVEKIDKILSTIPSEEDLANKFNESVEETSRVLNDFPPLPWFFKFIPEWKLKNLILSFYSALKLRRHYHNLDAAAENIKLSISSLAIARIKRNLLINIKIIPMTIILRLDETLDALNKLEEKLRKVQADLENEYPNHIPGKSMIEGYFNFQMYPANQDFTLKCFEKYAPLIEDIRLILLESMHFLQDWRTKDESTLKNILLEYGRMAYAGIRDVHIEEVLRNTTDLGSGDAQICQQILRVSNSTLNLLNPNWDFGENFGGTSIPIALIDHESNPIFSTLISDEWSNWQIIFTNDPYYYSFAKVRTQIPLRSIEYLTNPGELIWNRLTSEERMSVDILPGRSIIIPKVVVTEIEGSDGDLIQKTFRWTFEPKGNPIPVEQEISLKISRKRFADFKSKPRLAQQFNRYSEEEMPEIRDLAIAFQNLHRDHNWSTYNQAYNILTFVQSCIPYSYDKDSTSQNDWPRYPIETLMDGTGDCEDVAILCGAILARLGFSSALFAYPSHLAFGVQASESLKGDYVFDEISKKKYYYGEATAKGWRLGEIPSKYKNTPPESIWPITLTVSE